MSGARRSETGFTSLRRSAEFRRIEPARHAPGMAARRGAPRTGTIRRNGFTLIEMLVALAIFSLAALALLRLSGATATNSARINEQAIAQIVASNLAAEVLTDPGPPAFGSLTGEAVNGNRRWAWTRTVARSPEARIQQIEISVIDMAGGPGRARLTVFRNAQ